MGIPRENIFILENGNTLEFKNGEARRAENVSAGMFLVDAGAIADGSSSVMRERQQLSEDGMFIVVARVSAQNGQLLGPPDVISRGFVNAQGANGLTEQSIDTVQRALERTASRQVTDRGELKNAIRKDLSGFLSEKTGKRPIILPLIVEV
jgi:ribonuclease J